MKPGAEEGTQDPNRVSGYRFAWQGSLPARCKSVRHRCVRCGAEYPHEFRLRCDQCDGAIDTFYDLTRVKLADDENPLIRYFDLLPIVHRSSIRWLGERRSPCVHAQRLGREVCLENLYLKDETVHPTATCKDRMASVSLSFLGEVGVTEFVITSTGNSSTSYAYGAHLYPEFAVHIFAAEDFARRVGYRHAENVALHIVPGDFVEAERTARIFAQEHDLPFEGGFFNPARREGLKLAYLEAYEQMPCAPDYLFQAVSSGMGIMGAFKGIDEFIRLGYAEDYPRIVCVQQQTCCPMVKAFREDSPTIGPNHCISRPRGLAKAILRGDPSATYPYVRQIVRQTGGSIEAVSKHGILEARALLEESEGIRASYTGAVALAAAIEMRRRDVLKADAVLLVNVTGGLDAPREEDHEDGG